MNCNELTVGKATILRIGMMGLFATEVSAYSVGTKSYAGRAEAVRVMRINRGCRKVDGNIFTDDMNIVVIEGWGHGVSNELPDGVMVDSETAPAAARAALDAICAKARVLVDFRDHKTSGYGVAPKFAK